MAQTLLFFAFFLNLNQNTIRGMLHDERRYPNPMKFDPERWLSSANPPTTKPLEHDESTLLDPWSVVFGYGRRTCPGIAVAQTELWIVISMFVATFEIKPKVDQATGKPILPELVWSGENLS